MQYIFIRVACSDVCEMMKMFITFVIDPSIVFPKDKLKYLPFLSQSSSKSLNSLAMNISAEYLCISIQLNHFRGFTREATVLQNV